MKDQILTRGQIAFLEALAQEPLLAKQFYLTGGTPLAAFYLGHRYSEHLDFFSEEDVDPRGVEAFLKKYQTALGFERVDAQQSFNRNLFFLHYPGEVLKTEFTYFPFTRIEDGGERYGVRVDSLLDIAVNKLFSIYQRTKARDYIDLYVICRTKGYAIADLTKRAKVKFDPTTIDPLQLGSQFLKAKEVEDMPRLIRKIPAEEWQGFFSDEAEKLGKEILS